MKIRIKDNAIRYRLTKSEVSALASEQIVIGKTHFPDNSVFNYELISKEQEHDLEASFENNTIKLYLKKSITMDWPNNQEVGYERKVLIAPNTTLVLLVEKDFVCIDNTDEDQSDNYPNPSLLC